MNVTIIQEKGSIFGNIKQVKLLNVTKVTPADNIVLGGIKGPQSVIWCEFCDSPAYPIAYFPSPKLRDKAIEHIYLSSNKIVVLDYNIYFCDHVVDDQIVRNTLIQDGYTLIKAIAYAVMWIKNSGARNFGYHLDAFSVLSPGTYNSIVKLGVEAPVIHQRIHSIWSKTLKVETKYLEMGFTKLQIFKSLIDINNEKFISRRHI